MNPVHAGLYAHLGAFLEDVCLTWKSETALIEASRHREVHRWTYARFRAEVRSGVEEAGGWAGVDLAERFRFMPTDR